IGYCRPYSFFLTDLAPTPTYPLSLHDALPISVEDVQLSGGVQHERQREQPRGVGLAAACARAHQAVQSPDDVDRHPLTVRALHRSEEHTSELQSRENLVCRLLLDKKQHSNIHL